VRSKGTEDGRPKTEEGKLCKKKPHWWIAMGFRPW